MFLCFSLWGFLFLRLLQEGFQVELSRAIVRKPAAVFDELAAVDSGQVTSSAGVCI